MTERFSIYHEVLDDDGAIIEQNPIALAEGVEHIRLFISDEHTVLDVSQRAPRPASAQVRQVRPVRPSERPSLRPF